MPVSISGTNGVTFPDSSLQAAAASPYVLKNRIINGDMRIDQRNAGAAITPTASTYTLDRWLVILTQASKFSIQQNAGSVTPPIGFSNYLGITSSSAYSVLTNDTFLLAQNIEGFNTADLGFGTANAQTVTLSFRVRSSLTGTFGGALANSDGTRSYSFSYTVSSANTWTTVSITIAGDTTGTWVGATNGNGLIVRFGLGSGATYSGTAGAWASANIVQPTGTTSVVGTNGATFYITGVQLEIGTSATPFERRLYSAELAMCQRYYYKWLNDSGGFVYPFSLQSYSAFAAYGKFFDLPVTMRATPTCSASGTFEGMSSSGSAGTAFTGLSINSPTKNTLSTNDFTGSSGMSAGQCQPTRVSNNAFIQASAEL